MIIAVISQKGGVGKTSLVQNVGAELAAAGHATLLVDFDPQANLTQGWRMGPRAGAVTIYDAMLNPATKAHLSIGPDLDLIPANLDLAGAEIQFGGAFDRNSKLQDALAPLASRYKYILIDTPPNLGFFVSNALVAADQILIPLQAQFYALQALGQVFQIINQAQRANPKLIIRAIVPTMVDARNNLAGAVIDAARSQYGGLVTETVIPVNVRVADAPVHGLPVRAHAPKSAGAVAYAQLVKELFTNG